MILFVQAMAFSYNGPNLASTGGSGLIKAREFLRAIFVGTARIRTAMVKTPRRISTLDHVPLACQQ